MGAAISGLLVNNEHINTIANNIANASTIGYKSSKPVFFDIFSNSKESNSTYGHGVGISNIVNNFNDGTLIETGRNLDLGIAQNGFFRVIDSRNNVYYTRDGQFLLDKNKNIVNMQGMYLTGQNKLYSSNIFNNMSSIRPINLAQAHLLKAKSTSEIKLNTILNSNPNSIAREESYDKNILNPIDYSTQIDIYDKNGQKEKLNIYFNKKNTHQWKVSLESNDVDSSSQEKNINQSFNLEFNSNGELISEKIFNVNAKNEKYEDIMLDLTGTIEQSSIDNTINFFQDGYQEGNLETFNILPNGEIIGTYSNQQTQPIGQILLSKFINPEKLQYESGNLWSITQESGPEIRGIAGELGFGIINEKTLEASNVDLNKELINMMIAQRNYQSNAQAFKTEDKVINTLINLR